MPKDKQKNKILDKILLKYFSFRKMIFFTPEKINANHIIIHHHLGLGDTIVCFGLVNKLTEMYDKIYLPIKERYADMIRYLYKDNKKIGLWAMWYENGQQFLEGHFKDGNEHGLLTAWHENGQKASETRHKNGKNDGLDTEWYENGNKKEEAHFKNGELDGLWTTWHENGRKASEGSYDGGPGPINDDPMSDELQSADFKSGTWTFWNEKGQQIRQEKCDAGDCE